MSVFCMVYPMPCPFGQKGHQDEQGGGIGHTPDKRSMSDKRNRIAIKMPVWRGRCGVIVGIRCCRSVVCGGCIDSPAARLARDSVRRHAQGVSVELHTINNAEFGAYLQRSRSDYVNELVAAGMSQAAAAARADGQQSRAFPHGRAAPGHHVRAVVENERTIGNVWYGTRRCVPAGMRRATSGSCQVQRDAPLVFAECTPSGLGASAR